MSGNTTSASQQNEAGHTIHAAPVRAPVSAQIKNASFGIIAGAVVGLFLWMHGTFMGMDGPMKKWWGMKFRKTWNIY
ncbi:unnamed protein product [Tilletia controversa]|nr:unnamed protein product [Tilletia controversa]